jgi:acetolactate synthase-1/2/3 large subunit
MTTPDGKAIFPETHPLSLRTYGLAACQWPGYYLQPQRIDRARPARYDALCVLGSTLGELATNKWDPALIPAGPFIQIDIDQSVIARALPIDLGIVAELGAVVEDLFAISERTRPDPAKLAHRRAFLEKIKAHSPWVDPDKRSSDAVPILPQRMIRCINEALPDGSAVFLDAGNCVGWALHYLEIDPPSAVHSSLAMGPMGFGVGAAIGAKLGAPDRTCIGIVGDGAFLMHGAEVSTAAQYRIGAVLVVLTDNDLAMVSQGMAQLYPGRDPAVWNDYYRLGKPDIAMMARSLGADAYDVATPAEMERALAEAIQQADALRKPQVLSVHIDKTQVPPYYPKPSS